MAFASLKDLPIKRKLTVIVMATSGLALLLACTAFVTYEQLAFRRAMLRSLSVMAQIIGENSAAALSFNDVLSAEDTLRSLKAESHIIGAAIYNRDGKLFARYQRISAKVIFSPPKSPGSGSHFETDYLELSLPIQLAGEAIGTVYLQSDLEEVRARQHRYSLIVLAVMWGALAAALLVSRLMQKSISEPISHLAMIAGRVASEKDYSVRATKHGQDELGRLIDGFNEMLDQIQARDAELDDARDLLEKRVEERTGELRQEVGERQRSQNRQAESEHRLRMILAAQPECVKLVADDGTILDMNPAGLKMLEAERLEQVLSKPVCDVLVPEHRGIFQALNEAVFRGESRVAEFEIIGLKGTRRWMETHACPLRDTTGRIIAQLAVARDVTKRKLAEAELAKVHSKLLDASRQAGMSEVATAVLHNVGNVLNSLNVSATLVGDTLRRSRTSNLAKIVALMREHEADFGAFLTTDVKGRQIPGYLGALSEHLTAEQAGLMREVASLQRHVGHIRDIVAMQHNYARASGVSEIVSPVELIEDALRMTAEALARHKVRVVRAFEDTPLITVEKNKVLQILVNLLRNAKQALELSGQEDKQVTLRVTAGKDRICIDVADNGVGIAPENFARIFSHGFTTKQGGHGFGLHSAVLAAREMGGDLRVQSDGPGCGAAFTLELPQRPSHQAAA